MTADLRREKIARIAERHFPDETKRESVGYVMCAICPQTWPCDAAILIRSQDTATARIADKHIHDLLASVAFLRSVIASGETLSDADNARLREVYESARAVLSGETRTDPRPDHPWNDPNGDGHDCADCATDSMWKCDRPAHRGVLPAVTPIPGLDIRSPNDLLSPEAKARLDDALKADAATRRRGNAAAAMMPLGGLGETRTGGETVE